MALSSGIGTCIRQLVPLFNIPPFRLVLLVDKMGREWCKGIEQILFTAPIYSIREQLEYYFKVPPCDLFWSPHYNIPLGPIRAKKRIVTIHDVCHLYGTLSQKFYANIMLRSALYKSDAVLTNSRFSKSELIRFFGEKNIEVIHFAVDSKRFQRNLDETIRVKYRLPKKYILYVGSNKKHKNLAGLIKAIPHLDLVSVGTTQHLKNVPDSDLPAIYSFADVLVFPSFYEGFGLPPLEAMSCGCPTVVSNVASIPEICGDASLYINPACPDEIAQAIQLLGEDIGLREELIRKGYERIKQFDWARTAQSYLTQFEIALAK